MASSEPAKTKQRQHSAKLPRPLEERVARCMKLEGMTNFAECNRIALTRWCREIERENHIDADGKPVK